MSWEICRDENPGDWTQNSSGASNSKRGCGITFKIILWLQLNRCVHICNLICICIFLDRNTGGVVEVAEPGIVEAPATERRVWCSFLAPGRMHSHCIRICIWSFILPLHLYLWCSFLHSVQQHSWYVDTVTHDWHTRAKIHASLPASFKRCW